MNFSTFNVTFKQSELHAISNIFNFFEILIKILGYNLYFKFQNHKIIIYFTFKNCNDIKLESKFAIIGSKLCRINLYKYRKFTLIGK